MAIIYFIDRQLFQVGIRCSLKIFRSYGVFGSGFKQDKLKFFREVVLNIGGSDRLVLKKFNSTKTVFGNLNHAHNLTLEASAKAMVLM